MTKDEKVLEGIRNNFDMPLYGDIEVTPEFDYLTHYLMSNYDESVWDMASLFCDMTGKPWADSYSITTQYCAEYLQHNLKSDSTVFADTISLQMFVENAAHAQLTLDELLSDYRWQCELSELPRDDDDEILIAELHEVFVEYFSYGCDDGAVAGYYTDTLQKRIEK